MGTSSHDIEADSRASFYNYYQALRIIAGSRWQILFLIYAKMTRGCSQEEAAILIDLAV